MIFSATGNASAMTVARVFSANALERQTVEQRVSSGLKIAGALDDASSFSIAQGVRSEIKSYSAVTQSLRRLKGSLGVALAGATGVSELIADLKSKIFDFASADSSKRPIVLQDIDGLLKQIDLLVDASTFNGKNLIDDKQYLGPSGAGVINLGAYPGSPYPQEVRIDLGDAPGTVKLNITGRFSVIQVGGGTVASFNAGSGSQTVEFQWPGSPPSETARFRTGFGGRGSFSFEKNTVSALSALNGDSIEIETRSLRTEDLGLVALRNANPTLEEALATVDSVQTQVLDYVAYLGAKNRTIDQALEQAEFFEANLLEGLGSIVDADLARDQAWLIAGQIGLEMSRESLSLANKKPAAVLALMEGVAAFGRSNVTR